MGESNHAEGSNAASFARHKDDNSQDAPEIEPCTKTSESLEVDLGYEIVTPKPFAHAASGPNGTGPLVQLGQQLAASKANSSSNTNLLKRLYSKLHARFGGDPGKLTLFTIVVLLASELPIWIFTLLDVLKLKSVFPYRLHYDPSEAGHLGVRRYPPNELLWKTAKVAEKNFFCAYVIPGALAIKLADKLKIYVYDTDDKEVTWKRILKEVFCISVVSDIFFYGLHRMLHRPRFYKTWHKMHHEYRYSIALAHHWMTYKEALLFALPQALPPMVMWGLTGRKSHILSMWIAFVFTQLNVIFGHAGYQIPFIPKWLPFLQPEFHDFHHVDYSVNFGAIYPAVEQLFGTYWKAKMATAVLQQ